MNPDPNDLDPKLREAYERIMGTSQSTPAPQQPTTVTPPAAANQTPPVMQTQTVTPAPTSPPYQTSQSAFTQAPQSPPINPSLQKKKFSISLIFIILGVIIFLVIYAVVWAKIFGLF